MFLYQLFNNPETRYIHRAIDRELTKREYELLYLIVSHTLDEDRKSAVMPIKTLQELMGMKERSVRRVTKGLVDKGYILAKESEYTILMDKLRDPPYIIVKSSMLVQM